MLGLKELLRLRGFEPESRRVKLVRHIGRGFDIEELIPSGLIERYQQFQGKPLFHKCSQILSFVGEEGTKSRFIGIFDVAKPRPASETEVSPGSPSAPEETLANYWYPMIRQQGFEDYENRLVIDWGPTPRVWTQWFSDRAVLEIRPQGRSLPPFRDYLKVHLTFQELQKLAQEPEAHRDWIASLTAVGGVYLIVHSETGEQYVGSATGERGLWQRWQSYAKNGHGGNKNLVNLCSSDPRCPRAFTFSILETFSRTTVREVALSQENFFKSKLGSRAFGLNEN